MREIKYKGKRIDNGEWTYGFYAATKNGTAYIINQFEEMEQTAVGVDPETVCEFTGAYDSTEWEELAELEKLNFYDKNTPDKAGKTIKYKTIEAVKHLWKGKEIYEWDIVTYPDASSLHLETYTNSGVVEYDEESMCFFFAEREAVEMKDIYIKTEVKVIGNKFDNPELL